MKLVILVTSATALIGGSALNGIAARQLTPQVAPLFALGLLLTVLGLFSLSAITCGYWGQVSNLGLTNMPWQLDQTQQIALAGIFLLAMAPTVVTYFPDWLVGQTVAGLASFAGLVCVVKVWRKANFLKRAHRALRYN